MGKVIFDVISALIGLILLAPVFLVCAFLIWRHDGAPVFFLQTRVGLHGKHFKVRKFRTMTVQRDNAKDSAVTTQNDSRVTPVGATLRKLKIDELPQLINVVLGEMSLVGPRPEVPSLFEQYPAPLKAIMCEMRPGITDFASLEFIDENDMLSESIDPETDYIQNILPLKGIYIERYYNEKSFRTDLTLIFRTIRKIFRYTGSH